MRAISAEASSTTKRTISAEASPTTKRTISTEASLTTKRTILSDVWPGQLTGCFVGRSQVRMSQSYR